MQLIVEQLEAGVGPELEVEHRKHLAHAAGEVLGDAQEAVGHLEAGLELAPADPDLLLPLLDHYYARSDFVRALDTSKRVLEHVPIGAVAFSALANRATDAALAHGDHAKAVTFLDAALARNPEDARSKQRRSELGELAEDPEHRVRMLAAIAGRQSGPARHEALEERARILAQQLERLSLIHI